MGSLFGHASLGSRLFDRDVADICAQALAALPLDGQDVLVLIPDHTRHAPVSLFFRILGDLLLPRVASLDYLVATGTHAAMEPERLYRHLGLDPSEHRQRYSKVRLFNHEHQRRDQLVSLGTLLGDELAELTQGLFAHDIPLTINRLALAYDHILIVSPVVPHEAMGFSGGNKYFFPGIAGLDLVEKFHWLAAVISNPLINGVKHTPTRRVIDRAVAFLPIPRTCFAFAVDDQHQLACLYAGSPEEAWSHAADVSAQLHIRTLDRTYPRVLGLCPPIYEDLWVAGKAMYKLETIVADGGELVIHGEQIKTPSFVHGADIERIGYHVRDYFLAQWDRFGHESKLVLAHSANVKGAGSYRDGHEHPRIRVSLATRIARQTCEHIHLAYRDPSTIDIEAWKADPDTLVVPEAGQVLYRLDKGGSKSPPRNP